MTDPYIHLGWLPHKPDWTAALAQARQASPSQAVEALVELASCRIDFIQTAQLDRTVQRLAGQFRSSPSAGRPVRLAVLGSSTLSHLIPGIRIGALRRGIWVDVHEGGYATYRQELQDPSSPLREFRPDTILFALDAYHLVGGNDARVEDSLDQVVACWRMARDAYGCTVIQQSVLPLFPPLVGNNEHRYRQSPLALAWMMNERLRALADAEGVHLLAVDSVAARDGVSQWHDEALWHRSKQEIHPRVSHVYGDLVARLLAAIRGRSYKCLVLDLDNTLWGGVIGDDGLSGITIGQGSAVGEAHLSFQRYALALSRRGIILAVCSKNEEANAIEVFNRHPEMLLRRQDIACFVANWDDKATNVRRIARALNIGTDSLVFADDNPVERDLIRRELPEVAVPELPEDPAFYADCIAAAGYFESLGIGSEDLTRTAQYLANAEREALRETETDMTSYLASLQMELQFRPFDQTGLARIVQLINKTNQFNLTTRRYTAPEVQALLSDESILHLQFRLTDRFGDNGIIAVVVGKLNAQHELLIDTWLMSCRVLGRQVEAATLNVVVERARRMGAIALIGHYLPTPKNGMVRDHYPKLGFETLGELEGGPTWRLALDEFRPADVLMSMIEGP